MTARTIFDLDRSLVCSLAEAVAPGGNWLDVFARTTLTGITEPGDRVAGAMVRALGATLTLILLIERWTVPRILDTMRQGIDDGYDDDREAGYVDDDDDNYSPMARRIRRPRSRPDIDGRIGIDVSDDDMAKALARWQPRLGSEVAVRALRQAARVGASVLVPGTALWAPGLDDLGDHAPLALWWRGNTDALTALDNSIALVGARAATGYGEHVALEASAGLVDRGFAIVSGAAYGIDGMVHRSALASRGMTVAFLAGGVDRFYPSGHDTLLTRLVEVGAVISELPCGSAPTKWRFLQRNRLIAAASQATIVLEAGWRSGSLNTAGHAAALGRPLGAVPGPVTSPASAGCHRLIRDFDAVCVTSAEEMAELVTGAGSGTAGSGTVVGGTVGSDTASTSAAASAGASAESNGRADVAPEDVRMLDALSTRSPRAELDIAQRCGLSVATVQSGLGRLELEGIVAEKPTGWVRTRS